MEKSAKNNVITLRGYAKFRILNEMIEAVKKNAVFSKDYIIMILDDVTTKIFRQTCKMYDLFLFKVYHLEKLNLKRKRYQKTDAIYFISPSDDSVQKLINDYSDPALIQYGSVHLCFAGHVSEKQMQMISKCKELISRLKTFKEINIHFYLFEDNIFTLYKPEAFYLFNTEKSDIRTTSFLESTGYELFTVLSILLEKPYIQYQENSKFAESVAKFVNKNCDDFYSQLKQSEKKDKFRNPRARLIILDRSFDMIAPMQHDFAYQSLVYDTKETGNEKKVIDTVAEVGSKEDSKVELDETDEIWMRFKNKHLAETLVSLSNEVSNFAANNEKTSKIKKGGEFDIEEAMEAIRGMPKYKELFKKYTIHLQLSQDTMANFTECKWKDLISLEQKIITGVDETGKEITNSDIIKGITKISKDLKREDHTRLITQYLCAYELSEKDRYNMITSIQNDAFEQILENLPYVVPEIEDGKVLQRRCPKISESDYSTYRKKLDESSYDILRSVPKLSQITIDTFNDNLNSDQFPFVGDAPEGSRKGKKARKADKNISDILENPRIILFIIGGLSHHEIVSLHRIQEEGLVQCQVIAGSTSINRPNEFLNMLKDINKYNLKNNPIAKKDESRLSNIIDSSLSCSKSLQVGNLDDAVSNDKYTDTIKNYGIYDLANNEIIEKLKELNKIMYTVMATYPNANDQIQIPRNSDLSIQKVDDSIKDQYSTSSISGLLRMDEFVVKQIICEETD